MICCRFLEKVKRLEALLTKCKESIKTNKQKNSALTETNRSLSDQVTMKHILKIALS